MALRQRAANQKMLFFGHVVLENGLEKEMVLARGEGRRKRGCPMKRWMEEIHTMSGMDLAEGSAEDRGLWRRMTMMIAIGFNESMARGDKVTITILLQAKVILIVNIHLCRSFLWVK